MRRGIVFADTFYWLALIDPRDDWHARVQAVSRQLAGATLLTTDEVLVELLNALAGTGRSSLRQAAVANVERILRNPQVHVVPRVVRRSRRVWRCIPGDRTKATA